MLDAARGPQQESTHPTKSRPGLHSAPEPSTGVDLGTGVAIPSDLRRTAELACRLF